MRRLVKLSNSAYGAHPLHLLVLLAALALGGYTLHTVGLESLFNRSVWWQSIAVWFVVAIIAHDLILFPLYALADRLVSKPRFRADGLANRSGIPPTNYLRIPTLAAGLLFMLFWPGIIEQGSVSYHTATGLTQQPFLDRWLLITAVLYAVSAACYGIRVGFARGHSRSGDSQPSSAEDDSATG